MSKKHPKKLNLCHLPNFISKSRPTNFQHKSDGDTQTSNKHKSNATTGNSRLLIPSTHNNNNNNKTIVYKTTRRQQTHYQHDG